MSRIGKMPVAIPNGVTVTVQGNTISAKGSKGEASWALPDGISANIEDSSVKVECSKNDKQARCDFGTSRSLIANMIQGVNEGFSRQLEIHGVGFRAQLQGNTLTMNVGYSHPVIYDVPEDVNVEVKDGVNILISGIDKSLVGQVSARIRGFCPPEPYKGKGIRYKDEHVRRKVGKTVA